MSAVVSVATNEIQRDSGLYHAILERFMSRGTVDMQPAHSAT
jgi:hypothetical protein